MKLAVVDWDGDSRLDVLVNSENASWYRNCEDRDGTVVLKRIGNLAQRNVAGHTSSPAVCDFDSDGSCSISDLNDMLAVGPVAPGVPAAGNEQFDLDGDGVIGNGEPPAIAPKAAHENRPLGSIKRIGSLPA